jgi:A/G-specific adenine glycosylase
MSFQSELINWYTENQRDLPWRKSKNPYVIWLSEVILQQTRVAQGMPYFHRFLEAFPSVIDFANASEDQILKLWQGLGYYSRARNMLHTAKEVANKHQGIFPKQYEALIKLKGIGSYTAAAISSFTANEKRAVIDGNVYRVLSRYFGISTPIDSTEGKKAFEKLAKELIESEQPSVYNQAIMEFGALQCKPKQPNCVGCPLRLSCFALQNHQISSLPAKQGKTKVRERWFNYFLIRNDEQIAVHKREKGDIWQHLYDFPMIETAQEVNAEDLTFQQQIYNTFGPDSQIYSIEKRKHQLSHQTIYIHFFGLNNNVTIFSELAKLLLVDFNTLKQLPHPKIIGDFIEKHLN